jgi:Vam6/Vps39-like protein vacuolar protein sorting-associated protein 39
LTQELKLRTVRYLKALALFEQKKYDDSMDLFSMVSATPRIVIRLFPPVIAGEWSQHEDTEEPDAKVTEHSKVTEQGENGTPDTPAVASAIPEGLRANLDSGHGQPKESESDTSSILSKHTETSGSGPPGSPFASG